ncbi:hypothetical protein Calow_1835 [Caldicellulosiruptor owensensis OL]|uniref:Uncharacterized protein n=1 Tax=Caldicellulosiruptor owensensis (strain ATCC 700167 / DSM 13100 / OL) TaxID=632518 RepID=E4Q504_CALOW|nr:hypothetical protein [Caldicellulosiruptor owensensis]ADQ05364.1 hypothetical protein Calow_1835 [Caldicellulosiruptor owensensis OL]
MKGEQLLPEILALIGGSIVLIVSLVTKKSGEYTFFATAVVSFVSFICGNAIKNILNDSQNKNPR